VPLDHGVSNGHMPGIENIVRTVERFSNSPPDAFVLHKGVLQMAAKFIPRHVGVIMHLSASVSFSPHQHEKVLVGTVEEALGLGADGVSIHLNLGCVNDRDMLADFGRISTLCYQWGMPLMAMVYPMIHVHAEGQRMDRMIGHSVRVCEELGADIVKIPYVDDRELFGGIVANSSIPILIAGGEKQDEYAVLESIRQAMRAGGAGISIGRNIFQHQEPDKFLTAVRQIVHGELPILSKQITL
jgi:class I fructose-bisphosphate aldolase